MYLPKTNTKSFLTMLDWASNQKYKQIFFKNLQDQKNAKIANRNLFRIFRLLT